MENSEKKSWFDENIGTVIQWLILIAGVVYIYGQLSNDVTTLKELRKDDKQEISKAIDELKNEVKGLRTDIILLIRKAYDKPPEER